jgi:EAL domain-containing protein (putative c-di-GMP-specific phosphodiesterase class I)
VIAEGVEADAQHQLLWAEGCQAFQGYLFGRPMPREAFERSVAASNS